MNHQQNTAGAPAPAWTAQSRFLLALLCFGLAIAAQGADRYTRGGINWDANNSGNKSWATSSGGTLNTAWSPNDTAHFESTAGNISCQGCPGAGPVAFAMFFAGSSCNVQNCVTLGGPSSIGEITLSSGVTATISANLHGTVGLTVSGGSSATLVLSGNSTDFTGNITVHDNINTLQIGGSGRLGTGSFGGTISIGANDNFKYSSDNDQTLSGKISGQGSAFLIKDTSSSKLTLSNTGNDYSSTLKINQGTLALGASGALSSSGPVSLGGGTLDAQTYANTGNTLTLSSSSTINLGSGGSLAFADSHGNSWSGTLTVSGNFTSGSSLRFANSSGLTSGQLSGISMSASHSGSSYSSLALNGSGYLVGNYTLNYAAGANGSLSGSTSQTVNSGASGSAVTANPNTGYSFVNWSDSSSSDPRTDSSVAGNISVTANFAANTYTVTFNAQGGSVSPGSTTVTYNSTYGAGTGLGGSLPTPTLTGYTFNGWFTASSGGSQITSGTTVSITSAQTLYAQWTANTYTVTFNAQGGSVSPGSTTVTYNSTYGAGTGLGGSLPTPTLTGYTFKGWFTAASGGTQISSGTTVAITSAQTLYAQWTGNAASVTTSPSSTSTCFGAAASLTVVGSGTTSLGYAWRKTGASGWGQSWLLTNGGGGFFLGDSTKNGGTGTGASGSSGGIGSYTATNSTANTWCMYNNAIGSGVTTASRYFPAALSTGQTFQIDMDNGYVNSGYSVGFSLINSSGNIVWEFYFTGGNSDYTIHDNSGSNQKSDPYTDGGVRIIFTLTSSSTYAATVIELTAKTTNTYAGTLIAATGGSTPDGVRLFDGNNYNDGSGSAHSLCFNNLFVAGSDDNAGNYLSWTGDQGQAALTASGDISGVSTATLSFSSPVSGDAGNYNCAVYNGYGYAVSAAAALTVSPISVGGTATALNSTLISGNTTTVTVSGYTGTIQWQQSADGSTGWANVSGGSGATSATYTTPALSATTYYRAVLTSGVCSTANSSVATVTVGTKPAASSVTGATVCSGNSANVTVSASGSATLNYAWHKTSATGWGSGNAWNITYQSGNCDSFNGTYIGDSTAASQSPGINNSGKAFGLYANTFNHVQAVRNFASLTTGQSVVWDYQNPKNMDGGTGTVAVFGLQDSSGVARFELFIRATDAQYTINDNSELLNSSGVTYTSGGLHCVFTLTGTNTYNLTITKLVDGTVTSWTGRTLRSASGNAISQLRLYYENDYGTGGTDRDFFVNNIFVGNGYYEDASGYSAGACGAWPNGSNNGEQPLAGANLTGTNSATLTINPATSGDAGSYDVVVFNNYGLVHSSTASLTVNAVPGTPPVVSGLTSVTYGSTGVAYNVGTSNAGSTYGWTVSAGSLSGGAGRTNIAVSFSGVNAGNTVTISAYETNASGCVGPVGQLAVTVGQAPLTVSSGLTANNKPYDATTTATIGSNNVVLAGVIPADSGSVFISTNGYTATFATPYFGTGKTVTVSGLTLSAGVGTNYTLTQPTLTANVTPAAVTITNVTAASRPYNGTNTATLSGGAVAGTFNSDSVAITAGTGTFASKNVGTWAVTATGYALATTGIATNYSLSAQPSVPNQSITQATPPAFLLTASKNPAGYHDSLTFVATNLPVDATSNVVFTANGAPFSTNGLATGGATSSAITNLPAAATNIITAVYLGDNNYVSVSTNLTEVVTNHPPVAAVMTATRTAGLRLLIDLSDVATNWSNGDGTNVVLAGINLVSTNGVTIQTNSSWILYTNSAPNVNDQLSYSIADNLGSTNLGYINIVIVSSVTGTNSITGITTGVSNVISAYGIPGYSYILERATNLSPAVWVNVGTNVAATNGVINAPDTFWDLTPPFVAPSGAFYQFKWQP